MLIVFEGIDGTGKTTLSHRVAEVLGTRHPEVLWTREPGDSAAAAELARLFALEEREATPERELELFLEDRREHVAKKVGPALARGAVVVQDRTFYSTAAYQGARGMDVDAILAANRKIAPEPDLVVLLQLDPERALERIRRSRSGVTSFEKLESLRAVDRLYRSLLPRCPNMVALDADRSPDELLEDVLALVAGRERNSP